jgi:hypothetical protein
MLKDFFGPGFELYKFLSQKSRVKHVAKQMILRELANNIKRLEHRNNKGVNRTALIKMLENSSIVQSIQDGFEFNKLAPGESVDNSIVEKIPSAKRYIGWDAEKLMKSIDEKVVSVKDLLQIYDDVEKAPINITHRLNNLFMQSLLLSILIKKASKD